MKNSLEVIDLLTVASSLGSDTDYVLSDISKGTLLLLKQKPQVYRDEQHKVEERIVVLHGRIGIRSAEKSVYANTGQMIVVAAVLEHRFTTDSDGVVVVIFGAA